MTITVIGLDLAKSVFQAHGVDESGGTALVKKLHRNRCCRTRSDRVRWDMRIACCSTVFVGTKRIERRCTASQMASASRASLLPRFT